LKSPQGFSGCYNDLSVAPGDIIAVESYGECVGYLLPRGALDGEQAASDVDLEHSPVSFRDIGKHIGFDTYETVRDGFGVWELYDSKAPDKKMLFVSKNAMQTLLERGQIESPDLGIGNSEAPLAPDLQAGDPPQEVSLDDPSASGETQTSEPDPEDIERIVQTALDRLRETGQLVALGAGSDQTLMVTSSDLKAAMTHAVLEIQEKNMPDAKYKQNGRSHNLEL